MKFARHNLFIAIEIVCLCLALMSGCVLGWGMFGPDKNFLVISVSGCLFTLFLIITIALMLDPDRIRARQSMSVLNLASATLQAMQGGFNNSSAQRVCEVLYSASDASAVAITNRESVMGYYGAGEEFLGAKGGSIRTAATREVVEHGVTRVLDRKSVV